jgi:hypothetical protein
MATTNTTQAASKDGGRRGVHAALAAGVAALGLATALLAPWHQGGPVFAPDKTRVGLQALAPWHQGGPVFAPMPGSRGGL